MHQHHSPQHQQSSTAAPHHITVPHSTHLHQLGSVVASLELSKSNTNQHFFHLLTSNSFKIDTAIPPRDLVCSQTIRKDRKRLRFIVFLSQQRKQCPGREGRIVTDSRRNLRGSREARRSGGLVAAQSTSGGPVVDLGFRVQVT